MVKSKNKMRAAAKLPESHDLDIEDIADFDEISGDQQLVLVWCRSHLSYEWHWVERSDLREAGHLHTAE